MKCTATSETITGAFWKSGRVPPSQLAAPRASARSTESVVTGKVLGKEHKGEDGRAKEPATKEEKNSPEGTIRLPNVLQEPRLAVILEVRKTSRMTGARN